MANDLAPLAELAQHAAGYCGEGATLACFSRMRDLTETITATVTLIRDKSAGCGCLPGEYVCILLHEALSLLP